MFKNIKTYHLILTLQTILGIIFIFSGITKAIDITKFAEALANFRLLNDNLINVIKYALPIIEILLGIFIIFNFYSSLPSSIASLVLSFFTALIVAKLFEGEQISCGCFGALSSDRLDILSVVRNLILILIGIIVSAYYGIINDETKKELLNRKNKLFQKNIIKFLNVIFIANILFFLTTQNLIFALQNNGLKSRLALLIDDYDTLKKNEIVKPFEVYTVENKKVYIKYQPNLNKNTLIFLLKPFCSSCKLNLPNWIKLFNLIDTSKTRIFPISVGELENTVKYVSDNSIPFHVYFTNSDDFLLDYKAFLTPQTILIDHNGKVINLWKGILNKKIINDVLQNHKGDIK